MLNLKARWVFPVSGEPIRDGVVRIEDDRIVAVERGGVGQNVQDLGNVAILPGLVNAHTHLELSGFAEPLGWPGISIVDWIGLVVSARRSEDYDAAEAVRQGMSECARAGVAAVGDIVQAPPVTSDESIATTAFLELIGPTKARAAEALDAAAAYVGAGQGRGGQRLGLSPHAPYSVRPELLEGACRLSSQHKVSVAFHLSESREEMQLLQEGTGPFREVLKRLDAWDPSVQRAGRRPLDFLEMLATADRALVIHGNYLDEDEITFVARRSDRMSVVYCPRTHARFQHEPYPLESMLASGAAVALGTDSRASSPDLNLLEEMRTVAKRHLRVSSARIVEMGTLAGAKSLGLEAQVGSLELGKQARLAVIDLPQYTSDDPYQLLLGR